MQPVFPFADLPGGLFPYIGVQLLDQPVIFKQRDENARTDHTQFRMLPPHQCFGAGQDRHVRTDIKFRLIIDFELILRNGGRKIFDQLGLV